VHVPVVDPVGGVAGEPEEAVGIARAVAVEGVGVVVLTAIPVRARENLPMFAVEVKPSTNSERPDPPL
jgi:hypothetical protein